MNEKPKLIGKANDAGFSMFAVTKAFWLGDKHCAPGQKLVLSGSQAIRLASYVKPA